MPTNLVKHASLVGAVVLFFYALCLLWRYTMTDPEVMRFHLLALKSAFPGFQGYTAGSIIWGGILIFAYGFVGSVIFHSLHANCCKNCCAKK